MVGSYTIDRHVEATPEQVFRAFTDPNLLADWMDASAVIGASGPLDRAGTTYTLVIRGPWRFRSTVVGSEPHTRHESMGSGPLGASYHMVAILDEQDGGTALSLLTDYTVPLGPIGRWIDRRWLEGRPRSTANREVDRLVELVVRRPPDAAAGQA